MRTVCLLGACLVVLLANGWTSWQARHNRQTSTGGQLLLTEREAPLEAVGGESSVTLARLKWTTARLGDARFGPAAWLDSDKLAELGFDLSEPVESPRARRHYGSLPSRPVFLVLQCDPPAAGDNSAHSQLRVIDAARDPATLRGRYPDPNRHAIVRGSVRIGLRRQEEEGRPLPRADLVGWVVGLSPELISVPRPLNQALAPFRASPVEEENPPPSAPRYSVRVHWGHNYEPWVSEVR